MRKYKDSLGRELIVKFKLGGFKDTITCCNLYKRKTFSIFKYKIELPLVEIYSGVTSESLGVVAKWNTNDWDVFALNTIAQYNKEVVERDIVNKLINNLNT